MIGIVEYGMACLAVISLRSASNASIIMNNHGVILIAKAMRTYPKQVDIQKQCCGAIRNIAARSPQYRSNILDAG